MSPTSCDIYFDNNPSRVFYGGQLLNGRVVLKLFKEKTVRGLLPSLMTSYQVINRSIPRIVYQNNLKLNECCELS